MYYIAVALLTLLICIVSVWIRWRKKRMSLFERYGIPGPKPNFITGNINEFHEKREKSIDEWIGEYGKVFGFFLGAKPYVICTDIELIKTIQIKEFKKFANKDFLLPDVGIPYKRFLNVLEMQQDEKWKNMRNILSTSFTSGKIKMMSTLMDKPLKIFLKNIEEQKEEYFDIVEFHKKLTFDIVCTSAFGITTNVQKNETSKFVQSVYQSFEVDTTHPLSILSMYFPEFEPIPTFLRELKDIIKYKMNFPSIRVVFDTCKQIIDSRKKSEYHPPDLLQTILDAEGDSNKEMKKLSTDAVIANAVGFMIVGYDTTSNTLGWVTYLLSRHPEVQEKLRQEMNSNIKRNEDIKYEDLANLKYFDQVISETLRIFPLATITINRVCAEDFTYKDVTIPQGVVVIAPVPYLQKDPNYWHEPEKFNPDRFSAENKGSIDPFVYQPFGAGPRICIGMRLAQTIMKLTLAYLIRSFKIEPYEDEELELENNIFIYRAKNGIKVKAIPITS